MRNNRRGLPPFGLAGDAVNPDGSYGDVGDSLIGDLLIQTLYPDIVNSLQTG